MENIHARQVSVRSGGLRQPSVFRPFSASLMVSTAVEILPFDFVLLPLLKVVESRVATAFN